MKIYKKNTLYFLNPQFWDEAKASTFLGTGYALSVNTQVETLKRVFLVFIGDMPLYGVYITARLVLYHCRYQI